MKVKTFEGIRTIGFGNCITATGHIDRYDHDMGRKLLAYNTNEEGKMYLPHGVYTYEIGETIIVVRDFDDDVMGAWKRTELNSIPTPFGWTKEIKNILIDILNSN